MGIQTPAEVKYHLIQEVHSDQDCHYTSKAFIWKLYFYYTYTILAPFERLHFQQSVCKLSSSVKPPFEIGII